jgi:hypothetical protein
VTLDSSDKYRRDLEAIDDDLRAVESQLKLIRAHIKEEREAASDVAAIMEANEEHMRHLEFISSHLPERLPTASANLEPP